MRYPSYLNFSRQELEKRIEKLFKILKNCEICPRNCHKNRLIGERGYCQLGYLPQVSAFHPHFGEESVLVGEAGSGTIFFTSCNLKCVYCQNYEISQLKEGREVPFEELAEMMMRLQEIGCHNINLVTPTPQVPQIIMALKIAIEKGLKLPLVYNTSSYDSVKTLKLLDGIVDIYMPDAKYSNNKFAVKYSSAPDYFQIMKKAIKEMYRQVGDLKINKKGIAEKGLLIRHLILPGGIAGSEKILKFIAREISQNSCLNIMAQYYPCWKALFFKELKRRITFQEYQEVLDLAKKFGLKRILK